MVERLSSRDWVCVFVVSEGGKKSGVCWSHLALLGEKGLPIWALWLSSVMVRLNDTLCMFTVSNMSGVRSVHKTNKNNSRTDVPLPSPPPP